MEDGSGSCPRESVSPAEAGSEHKYMPTQQSACGVAGPESSRRVLG